MKKIGIKDADAREDDQNYYEPREDDDGRAALVLKDAFYQVHSLAPMLAGPEYISKKN
jgi:hypothetical protein